MSEARSNIKLEDFLAELTKWCELTSETGNPHHMRVMPMDVNQRSVTISFVVPTEDMFGVFSGDLTAVKDGVRQVSTAEFIESLPKVFHDVVGDKGLVQVLDTIGEFSSDYKLLNFKGTPYQVSNSLIAFFLEEPI